MAFPVSIQGSPGFDKQMTSGKKHRLGTRMEFGDGRVFYYGLSSEAITAGKVCMSGAVVAGVHHAIDMVVPAAVAAGKNRIVVTNENTAITGTGKFTGDFTTAGTYEGEIEYTTSSSAVQTVQDLVKFVVRDDFD